MEPTFFRTPNDFRQWFEKHHLTEKELIVGFYKKGAGLPSIDWPQSVDQALCFGWIDGIRKSIDENSYQIRFTPRRPKSHWSAVNIKKIKELIESDLMRPAGLEVWNNRDKSNQKKASFEQGEVILAPQYEALIKANPKAWEYYCDKIAPFFKKQSIHWIMSAKREETQLRRLSLFIEHAAMGQLIPQWRYSK